jgi:hypothetical protein
MKSKFQINLIRPGDGVVLTIADMKPEEVNSKRNQLTDILQEQTGLTTFLRQHLTLNHSFINYLQIKNK